MFTLAWDVDDVLNDLMHAWLACQQQTGQIRDAVPYSDLLENPPHDILGMSPSGYLDSLDAFRTEKYQQLKPVRPVLQWFETHGTRCRHVALTAVPFLAAPESAKWVITHFGQWIRTYHYVPSYRAACALPEYDRSKGDFLQWIKHIDCLVDDNESHVREARAQGIEAILFPRPWNAARDDSVDSVLSRLDIYLSPQTECL